MSIPIFQVHKYDIGEGTHSVFYSQGDKPTGVAVHGDFVYVSDINYERLTRIKLDASMHTCVPGKYRVKPPR